METSPGRPPDFQRRRCDAGSTSPAAWCCADPPASRSHCPRRPPDATWPGWFHRAKMFGEFLKKPRENTWEENDELWWIDEKLEENGQTHFFQKVMKMIWTWEETGTKMKKLEKWTGNSGSSPRTMQKNIENFIWKCEEKPLGFDPLQIEISKILGQRGFRHEKQGKWWYHPPEKDGKGKND